MNGLIDESTQHLEILARGPSIYAQSHNGYFVNGYKFHTRKHGNGLVTLNFGVCVRGESYSAEESDYYGLLDEVLELQYDCNGPQIVVLFKCTWFDNKLGVVVSKNKLVNVKHKSRLQNDDDVILASQAEQVFYTPYPAMTRDTKDLWAVVKTKARHIYEVTAPETDVINNGNTESHDLLQTDERFPSHDFHAGDADGDDSGDGDGDDDDDDDDEDDDDEDDDEIVYLDHSSDERHDCSEN